MSGCLRSGLGSFSFSCFMSAPAAHQLLLLLLHVRVPEADGGALLVSALRGWGHNYFQCEVCQ
jgi:hypothetical protein